MVCEGILVQTQRGIVLGRITPRGSDTLNRKKRSPSKPPTLQEKEEELSEEELEEVIEESERELKKKEREESPPIRGEQREKIKEDLARGWDQLLKPQFEGRAKEYEKDFRSYFLSAIPIANIKRKWIPRYLSYFDENWLWMKLKGMKMPPYLWPSFRMVFELNLTRAISGLQREVQRSSKATTQEIESSIEQGWNKYIEPDFEDTELENYSKYFSSSLSNVVPLANIQEGDIDARYLKYFDEVWQWMKIVGVKVRPQGWSNFRFVLEINLTKSIKGFEMKQQADVKLEGEGAGESKGVLESLIDTLRGV